MIQDDRRKPIKKDDVELRPGRKPREGWAEAFQQMAERGDDRLMDEPTPTAWEKDGWDW